MSAPATQLQPGDREFLSPLQAAHEQEPAHAAAWAIYLMLAALARVDMITRSESRVVPVGREQVIASLEGGILRELKVREGEAVVAGQALALLDPTRVEAQQNEGRLKRLAMLATVARLQAETSGRPLAFAQALGPVPQVTQSETDSYNARQRALNDAVASGQSNQRLLEREMTMAAGMAAKGLLSEVEVMRLRRQVNDLNLATQERINRFRQDASAELVRVQTELTMLGEQQVVRDDILKRTVLTSPVRGLVRNIRMNTLGGVVSAGAPVMEIVPVDDQVLVELRINPSDIGFIKVGQPVEIKLSAYDYTVYGSLHGQVDTVSPDALGDPNNPSAGGRQRYLVPRPGAGRCGHFEGRRQAVDGVAGHDRHGGDPHRPPLSAELPAVADDEGDRGVHRALNRRLVRGFARWTDQAGSADAGPPQGG